MLTVPAPMLCSVANGNQTGEDSWTRQDYRDGVHSRSRAERRYKVKARRTARRAEKMAWMDELAEELNAA